jgi:hypothetical protein
MLSSTSFTWRCDPFWVNCCGGVRSLSRFIVFAPWDYSCSFVKDQSTVFLCVYVWASVQFSWSVYLFCTNHSLFLVVGGTGVWTKDLVLDRQALYHLCHTSYSTRSCLL